MALAAGTQLGPYEIEAPLGAGGMGEVYRARDSRLRRTVALKVLTAAVAGDGGREERFRREAQVLAQLNHPHIAQVYGFEAGALAMELVAGPTLAERGALPPPEAQKVALELCAALEYAHERGIIHRDLKPANIKLSPEGGVKVLDFGLAKALEPETVDVAALADSPTLSRMGTQAGVILGTAAYMAPEQARGRAADRRSDIFSFGCVLYEMLTGAPAFGGETVTDILAAVVLREPEWSKLPKETPPRVRRLLRRCLEKDPRQRLQAIGEARIALEGGDDAEQEAGTPAARPMWPWAVAALAVVLAAVALAWAWSRPAAAVPVRRYGIAVPDLVAGGLGAPAPVLAPDGQAVAYVAGVHLYVRRLAELAPHLIYSFAAAPGPVFWSPDGRWLGLADQGRLWRVAAGGGEPQLVCPLPGEILAAAWGQGGNIFFSRWRGDLYEVSAQGGEARALGVKPADVVDFHALSTLPGAGGLLLSEHQRSGGIKLMRLDAQDHLQEVGETGANAEDAVYTPPGYLVYSSQVEGADEPSLWAVPFSLARFHTSGAPFRVVTAGGFPAVGPEGTLLYTLPGAASVRQLVWVSAKGQVASAVGVAAQQGFPVLSPDGGEAVTSGPDESGAANLALYDLARGARAELLGHSPGGGLHATWTRDGKQLVFSAFKDIQATLYLQQADGSGPTEALGSGASPQVTAAGHYLVFLQSHGAVPTPRACYVALHGAIPVPLPAPVCLPQASPGEVQISPNERWAAYVSGDADSKAIFLTAFPSGSGRWPVSNGEGRMPVWSRDGHTLYYLDAAAMMAVSVGDGAEPHLGLPRRLFSVDGGLSAVSGFDVAADGRFLMLRRTGAAAGAEMVVVQNWTATLKPGGGG